MTILLRLFKSASKILAYAVLLLACLVVLGLLLWSLERPRAVLTLLFLLGMVAYAFSDEGRRLLSDMQKW